MKDDFLSLTISTDEGNLFVLLTDTKRTSRHGWARTDLQNIRSIAAAVEPAVLQDLVFPISVNQAIENSEAAVLLVQMPPELAFLPIEAFKSSNQRWCEKFAMGCFLPNLGSPDPSNLNVKNSLPIQIEITLTATLFKLDKAPSLVNHFFENGLKLSVKDTGTPTSTVIIASTANDAAIHVRDSGGAAPEICVWPCDSSADDIGLDVAAFSNEFPASTVLTGHNYESIEQLILGIAPALSALNEGLTPLRAIQLALQSDVNKYRTLRLYNCDDEPLCRPRSTAQVETENRTITALSIDLVASTKMMHRIGNERYSEVLATLKKQCIKCIYDRGGSSGGRAGDDSTMAYFGLPNALENTAACAMDTALAVRSILPSLPGQPELRIGIATGRVAVRSGVPYGEPIHLAARLQAFGEPGDIVVDTASQWLARQDYEFEACGDYATFHGISHPVLPIKLITHAKAKSANTQTNNTSAFSNTAPFIGRAYEISALKKCWQRVCQGEQSIICVRGEAGIGKSRLVREFLTSVLLEDIRVLKLCGLSDYQGSVFYSLKESLKRGFGIQTKDSQSQVRQRIREVATFPRVSEQNIVNVAQLLGITEGDYESNDNEFLQASNMEHGIRDYVFELLTEAIDVAARDRPLVLIVDDLQWIDPSTREALEHVINVLNRRIGLRFLVLCTERNDQTSHALPNARALSLDRMDSQVAGQFIRNVVGEKLPAEAVDRLVARAEGVPLFLEESARLALEQPEGSADPNFSVPDSIDSLLMSRLENLDKAGKYLVQIASVIGREFQIELLYQVVNELASTSSVIDFQAQIESFRKFGVLSNSKAKGPPRLTFRHEMIRDVAYTSMWQRDRNDVHAAIARVMLDDQFQQFAVQPGTIALHLTLSEQHEQSIVQWEIAARLAADASANQEAIHNLRSALLSLAHLGNSEKKAKKEMRLQLMLAARLIASVGYGAEEVKVAYERAQLLVRQFGERRDQLKVMLGLETVHVMRGELEKAESLAVAAVEIANQLPEHQSRIPALIQTKWALGNIKFHQGYPNKALVLMNQCLEDCRATNHRSFAVQDPEIMCLCYSSWILWEQGLSDTAHQRASQALDLARSRQHRFSEAEALGFYASLAMFRGEYSTAIVHADNAIAVCEQENFVIWLAHARVIRGRSIALRDGQAEGLVQMVRGYDEWVSTGAVITRAFYLALIAETLLETGDLVSATDKIRQATEIITLTGDRYHLAEVLRIQGLIAYSQNEYRTGDSLMRQAIDIARVQEKHTLTLRASTAMAKSLASREQYAEAIAIVEKALPLISEGQSTFDLVHSRTLLSAWKAIAMPNFSPSQSQPVDTNVSKRGRILAFPKRAND